MPSDHPIACRVRRAMVQGVVLVALALCGSIATPRAAQAQMSLVMVEEAGCVWCARWRAEVGDAYPVTPEGRAAPLWPMDIGDPALRDLDLTSRPVFTPTFILIEDGVELSRLEGYPGEDFFWGLLGQMLDQADPGWADQPSH